jgi:hypothetical protein
MQPFTWAGLFGRGETLSEGSEGPPITGSNLRRQEWYSSDLLLGPRQGLFELSRAARYVCLKSDGYSITRHFRNVSQHAQHAFVRNYSGGRMARNSFISFFI